MSTRSNIILLIVLALLFASALIAYARYAGGNLYIDEITYARLGSSLIQGHLASDSSFYSVYQQFGLTTNGISTPYGSLYSAQPWLDHPPLVGFLLIPILAFNLEPRLLPIILWNLTALGLYLMLEKQSKVLAYSTILASILYEQYFVLPSMLFLESGMSFFLILTIVFTINYSQKRSSWYIYSAGITAGLSALSKEVGIASILYLVLFWIYDSHKQENRDRNSHFKAILIASALGLSWVIYALVVQPALFIDLVSINLGRSVVSNNSILVVFQTFVTRFMFDKNGFADFGIDYKLVISWFGIAYLFARKLVPIQVKLGLLSYGFFFLLLRSTAVFNTIPFFPFYALAMGLILNDLCVKASDDRERLKAFFNLR